MTRFEKHYNSINNDFLTAREILKDRQKEIKILKEKRDYCKNEFRWQCITKELE